MEKRLKLVLICTLIMVALSLSAVQGTKAQAGEDKGESRENRVLKNRLKVPKEADIDKDITLDALLTKKGSKDLSTAKAAVIEGHVIQVEREEDGDYHLTLASKAGETDTNKWVIVEVTPAWQKRKVSLSNAQIKKLHGKKIRVEGWLFYEPDEPSNDPRGTGWELHPVTNITVLND